MSTDWRKDPKYKAEPKVGLSAYYLRHHLADVHGHPTRGLTHPELVRIHEDIHAEQNRR